MIIYLQIKFSISSIKPRSGYAHFIYFKNIAISFDNLNPSKGRFLHFIIQESSLIMRKKINLKF